MSSTVNPQSDLPNNDELVAYLDGELPPEECRVVEDRLATDEAYRQQLRDLDLAWEALSALPPATVDDSFARTTIELACVVAQDDLSQRKTLAEVDNRSHTRRWIGAGVVAAVVGFLIVRVLTTHHANRLLSDLPVIQQSNALSQIENIAFLRQLAKAVPAEDFVKDDAVFQRDLADFNSANSASLGERREWVDSLSPDQKANLAERARAFEDTQQSPTEKNRLRELANDVSREPALEKTLVAYSLWVGRHSGGQQEQLRETVRGLSTEEHVAEIQKMVREENDQAARHLKPEDEAKLRAEIFRLAGEKKADLQKTLPGGGGEYISHLDPSKPGAAIVILRTAIQNNENGQAIMDSLVSKLSPEAQDHWKKMNHGRREHWIQLWQWVHDAMKPKYGPEDIEQFFVSDELSADERQRLLEMPRVEMKNELERLYLGSKEGVDNRAPFWRDFGDGGRGPRSGPGDMGMGRGEPGGRPGDRPRGFQSGPPDQRVGPDGPPRDQQFDRDRPPGPGPGGPRMRPEDRPDNGRPGRRPRRPGEDDGAPQNGAPPGEQSPPPDPR